MLTVASPLVRLTPFHQVVNNLVWVTVGLPLLIGTGVLMTILTRGFQFSRLRHWLSATIGSLFRRRGRTHTKETGGISQFQAVCTALAASLGVGNIAGVAAAIAVGGAGAVFWMWIAAVLGMMTGFAENVLGIYYRRKVNGGWVGGAMYYLRDGLGGPMGRGLAWLFSLFTITASFGIGNLGQVNQIIVNMENAFDVPAFSGVALYEGVTLYTLLIGTALTLLVGLALLGGLQRIATLTEKIVPTMVVLFTLGSLAVIMAHSNRIGAACGAIFRGAFGGDALLGGVTGVSLRQVITRGFQRGAFSNEAGLGSTVLVHAAANVTEPVQQGMWSIFEVFADTIVICTLTALVILTAAPYAEDTTAVGEAFTTVFGAAGEQFVAVAILLFAFSTVLGWSQIGVRAAEYVGGVPARRIYTATFVPLTLSGALMPSATAWEMCDIFNGLMMIPNLIGVVVLSGQVRKITQNYIDRKIKNRNVTPLLSYDARIQKQLERMK